MNCTVYFLSILDGIGSSLTVITAVGFVAGVLAGVVHCVAVCEDGPELLQNRKLFIIPLVFAVVACVLNALVPSTRSLRDAYLYSEAVKLVTAPNAQKVAEEAAKRVDKIIELLEHKK